MNISGPFIRRPVATILLSLSMIMAGFFAYKFLPVAALPQVDFPTISVTAQLPGASPETMASAVATPIIKEFSTIPSLQTITASSVQSSTSITLEFNLSRDIDQAAADVQAALARTQRRLPAEMPTPPSYRKLNPADAPVVLIALTTDTLPLSRLDAFAQQVISPALSTIDGVGQVLIFGSQKFAVRIQLDPNQLATRGIGVDEVQQAVQAANVNTPVGTIDGGTQQITLQATTQLYNATSFAELIVANRGGKPVRLADLARVIDSVENNQTASWSDGTRALVLAVQRQADANTVEVVDRVRALLPSFADALGPAVDIRVLNDRSVSIREAVHDVEVTLVVTIGLVFLVILSFLGRLSTTMIPSLAVPISILGTFGVMYLLGFSLNNVSLLAVTLAVGLVVDDAIVVLENIVRYIEAGMRPFDAALKGAGEIGFTVVSITLSLVAVFLPVLLMGGVVGRLFNEFAVTVTVSLAVSAAVSLTLTPMLAARLPARSFRHAHGKKPNLFERAFALLLRGYEIVLDLSLRWRAVTLLAFVATVAATVWMFITIPKGFFPTEDIGQIQVATEARQDVSFDAMVELQSRVYEVIRASPHVAHAVSSVGVFGGSGSLNQGRMFVELKPREERAPLPRVLSDLRRQLAQVPGISAFLSPVQNLRLGGRQSRSQYQFVVQSIDTQDLYTWSTRLVEAMGRETNMFTDVATDLQNNALQVQITVDRDKARRLGVGSDQLRSTLYTGFGARQISTIYNTGDSYQVIIEFDRRLNWTADRLDLLKIRAANGTLVPLSTFASFERTAGLLSVNQVGQLPAVTISFDTVAGISLGEAISRIAQIKVEEGVPPQVRTTFAGSARVFQEALANQGLLLLAAVLTVYTVLGILYESFVHPLTILTGLPAAAVGALGALQLFSLDLTVIAIIGILMLIGIVKKNAIMMIDFALHRQREGVTPAIAIRDACLIRFRPIMMTTLAALMGALPLAMGYGASSEFRQPLGIAVVGGLLFSQVLTLLITPAIYLLMEQLSQAVARLRTRGSRSENLPDEAPQPAE